MKRKRDRLLSRKKFCYWKAVNIACSECVSVSMVAQHAKHTERYFTDIGDLSDCTKFFHII